LFGADRDERFPMKRNNKSKYRDPSPFDSAQSQDAK
jgi:hypothetical protein